ncbi:MAG: CHAD domain-containing protein [Billgrantia sp.]|uniref:CHAD domain-containing protein n=2 Tax=Halomonadaceae TaxID=28256 RepID=UPI00089F5F20|nr:CHAD domain-containing protein [Halomonas desiderata]MCE8010070.1 CHAD domain-containing protein [Halomonas desiderata]SEF94198.1 phosphohistidine phosphatase [Halomonas desiderata]
MKHLFLIRHARAMRPDDIEDRQRPLSPRGQCQAVAMAPALQRLGALDGELHVSSALRAQQTLQALDTTLPELGLAKRAQGHEALYTFEEKALLQWLQALDEGNDRLALIGHNPALLALAQRLSLKAPKRLPTGGLIYLTLPTDTWRDLGHHTGETRSTLSPVEVSHTLFQRKAPAPPQLGRLKAPTRIQHRLMYQYRMIRSLEAGVSAGHDPEFLHQYRVNLRRSRAIGEALLSMLDTAGLRRALKGLRRHARVTSELRDLDVMLENLIRQPAGEVRESLEPMVVWLQAQAREVRRKVRENLQRRRYAQDMQAWQELIASPQFTKALARLRTPQIDRALHERLARHDALLTSLDDATPDAAIHRLRKQVKRIRYLAELAPDAYQYLLEQLEERQERLGEFQDLCTQLDWLDSFVNARQERPLTEETRDAMRDRASQLVERKDMIRRALRELPSLADKVSLSSTH